MGRYCTPVPRAPAGSCEVQSSCTCKVRSSVDRGSTLPSQSSLVPPVALECGRRYLLSHHIISWLQLAEIGFHSIPTALALPRANSLWAGTPRDIKTLHTTHSPSPPPSGPPQQILRLFKPLVQKGSPVRQAQLRLTYSSLADTYTTPIDVIATPNTTTKGQQLTSRPSRLATQSNLVYLPPQFPENQPKWVSTFNTTRRAPAHSPPQGRP